MFNYKRYVGHFILVTILFTCGCSKQKKLIISGTLIHTHWEFIDIIQFPNKIEKEINLRKDPYKWQINLIPPSTLLYDYRINPLSENGKKTQLCTIDIRTGVINCTDSQDILIPTLSPNCKYLAFTKSNEHQKNHNSLIYICDYTTLQNQWTLPTMWGSPFWMKWSFDSRYLIFHDSNNKIIMVDIYNHTLNVITNGTYPIFSSTPGIIYFLVENPKTRSNELVIFDWIHHKVLNVIPWDITFLVTSTLSNGKEILIGTRRWSNLFGSEYDIVLAFNPASKLETVLYKSRAMGEILWSDLKLIK